MSGEKKYYLANLSAKTDLGTLAATIKARWICEHRSEHQGVSLMGLGKWGRLRVDQPTITG